MARLADIRRIVEWVVWEVRVGNLPDDVKDAVRGLSLEGFPRPAGRDWGSGSYYDGSHMVTGFPDDGSSHLDRVRCFPHQVADVVSGMTSEHRYILVERLT